MPRNPSGEYTLPLPPVVSGQTIEATWANQTLADLAQSITDSLSRTGSGDMQVVLKLVDGTTASPGLSFSAESNTGLHRAGAGDLYVSVLGQDYLRITNENGVQISYDGANWFTVASELYVDEAEVGDVLWNSGTDTLTLSKATGDLTVVIEEFSTLLVNGTAYVGALAVEGPVNQVSNEVAGSGTAAMTADTSLGNRWRAANNGNSTLTITKPTGPVVYAGGPPVEEYTVEGSILFTNNLAPGVITIAGAGSEEVLGSNSTVASGKCMLTYVIHRLAGDVYDEIYVWSAVP